MGIDIKQEKHNKSANQKKKKRNLQPFFLYNRYMYISISKGRQLFC